MTVLNGTDLAQTIRVADLRAYLLANGWQYVPFPRPQVLLFRGPPDDEGRPIDLLIPASEQLRDYTLRLEEILRTLSVLENRPAYEIVRTIITPTSDILHLRIDSPETRAGTLPLNFARTFFASVRNLLVFAACAEIRPQPCYPWPLKQAIRLTDRCRLRPAPTGSFCIDVEAPVAPPANQAQVDRKAYPPERLVLLSLMASLAELQRSVEEGQPGRVLAASRIHISANLCEAILNMCPASSSVRWEARVSWSPAWPLDQPPADTVVFEGRAFEHLESVSWALRSDHLPARRLLRGRVVRLVSQDPVRGETGLLAVTLAIDSAGGPTHVEVPLRADQYRQACLAHLEGRRIAVRGTLVRVGRRWQTVDVSDFQVLDEAVT